MGSLKKPGRCVPAVIGVVGALLLAGGCAEQTGRRQLERVAKDWCESIRASQVIPVYPLTEDLRPGDVFMVPLPIQEQARLYKDRGFLPLDDLRLRLPIASAEYRAMYFDAYWKDVFAREPNARPVREQDAVGIVANAPRATFPSYAFEVKTAGGAALALPIHGIPVALEFMNADAARGTITISDARTYAAQAQEVYDRLREWAERPDVRLMLADVQRQRGHVVYLRAVTRVYMAGAVDVMIANSSATGAGARGGLSPEVAMISADGTVNENRDKVLAKLDEAANRRPVLDAAGKMIPGAGVKFTSASARSVSLAEAFDTLLAIGYLGFDVPVYEGGVLGGPVPTFARLEGAGRDPVPARVDVLTPEQTYFQMMMKSLEESGRSDPARAVRTMEYVIAATRSPEFEKPPRDVVGATASVRDEVKAARAALGGDGEAEAVKKAVSSFKNASMNYVKPGGAGGVPQRYQAYRGAFIAGLSREEK